MVIVAFTLVAKDVSVRHFTPDAAAAPQFASTTPPEAPQAEVKRTPSVAVPEELAGGVPTPVEEWTAQALAKLTASLTREPIADELRACR